MPIPPFQSFFRPFLTLLARDGVLRMRDIQLRLQEASGLTQEELAKRLPSGTATVVENRIGWTRTYMFKAGLIERVKKATYKITDAGIAMLASHPSEISVAHLYELPSFRDWHTQNTAGGATPVSEAAPASDLATTSETMALCENVLRGLLEEELRERLTAMTPARFEWLVEQLVVKLGYGASDSEVRAALSQGAGDGGVDGVIKEDRLGLGQIYLQAKRWKDTVGRPVLQAFVGAMHGRAQKGVFITTSEYSKDAIQYAKSLHGMRLRLIDGQELAALMVDCGLGVSEEQVFRTYRIDGDFFEQEE